MWTERDQDLALAWELEQQLTCQGCGTRRDEWGTFDEDGILQRSIEVPYQAATTQCPGCEAIDVRTGNMKERPPGVYVVLKRRTSDPSTS